MVLPIKDGGASRVLARTQGERSLSHTAAEQWPRRDLDLLNLAAEMAHRGDIPLAHSIYQTISTEKPERSPILSSLAQEQLSILQGRGGTWFQGLEHQASRFLQGATQPSMVLGMAAGATAFNATRALVLPRLMRSSFPLFSQIPFATRTLASTIAMVPEVGAFWGSSKLIHHFLQPKKGMGNLESNLHEIAGLTMTLGFLKSFGFAFGRMGAWAKQSGPASPWAHPSFWQQSGMLGGIMAAHGAEISLGWRPQANLSSFVADSFITLTQFNAGGALSNGIFPRIYRLNQQLQGEMVRQEQQQLETLQRYPWKEKLIEPVLTTSEKQLQEAVTMGPGINFSKSWGERSEKVDYKAIRFRNLREKVGKKHPELQNLLEAATAGNLEALERLQQIRIEDLVEKPEELNADTGRVLMALSEIGHREAMQILANFAVNNDGLVTMLLLYEQNGSARVRQALASISLSPLIKPAEEGNIRAARILELLAYLGRSDAVEALGHVAPKNAAAAVGLFKIIERGDPTGQVISIIRKIEPGAFVKEMDRGDARHLDLVANLMIAGNPMAAQALADRAATNMRVLKIWREVMKTLNSLVAANLKRLTIQSILPLANRENYFALQVLRDLASLGNDRALSALKDLAADKHGPALIVLRDLVNDFPELRPVFFEAANQYGLPVKIQGTTSADPISVMAFFETFAVDGKIPSIFAAFSEVCKIIDLDRLGTLRLVDAEGADFLVDAQVFPHRDHPFHIGDKVLLIHKLGGGSGAEIVELTPEGRVGWDLLTLRADRLKFEEGFSSADLTRAKEAWEDLQSLAGNLGIYIRFGKNHYFDAIHQSGGIKKTLNTQGEQIILLKELLELLPRSLLKHGKLRAIRLNTQPVGEGEISSYENSNIYLFEKSFQGSRRDLVATTLHQLGKATATRYSILPQGSNIPRPIRLGMNEAHETIAQHDAFLSLDYGGGRLFREGVQFNSFSEFMAECHLLYVADGTRLRNHIQSFPPGTEIREAWDFVYQELRDRIFAGREYTFEGEKLKISLPPEKPEGNLAASPQGTELAAVGEGAEVWTVHYKDPSGEPRNGSLVPADYYSPEQRSKESYREKKYTVEAIGGDGSLILTHERGRTLIARGSQSSLLSKLVEVGEEVYLMPPVGGGSPSGDKKDSPRLPDWMSSTAEDTNLVQATTQEGRTARLKEKATRKRIRRHWDIAQALVAMHDAGLGQIRPTHLASARDYIFRARHQVQGRSLPPKPVFLRAVKTYQYPVSWQSTGRRQELGRITFAKNYELAGKLPEVLERLLGKVVEMESDGSLILEHPRTQRRVRVQGVGKSPLPHPFRVGDRLLLLTSGT
jgi:hypothetical protein